MVVVKDVKTQTVQRRVGGFGIGSQWKRDVVKDGGRGKEGYLGP